MSVKPIPDGYHVVTPYLIVKGVDKLLDFMQKTFDAKVVERHAMPDGNVMHAEAKIGDSIVMMGEAMGNFAPIPAGMYIYVEDTDKTYQKALAAGATSTMPPADQFYGDRNAGVKDMCGNQWWIATRKENLTPQELAKRAEENMKKKK
ncbi:MAG: VOC family protein [candidate division Zixibacteria bacterium]|nr:VOC family protein [candidate division Zixibacteria bacterium]